MSPPKGDPSGRRPDLAEGGERPDADVGVEGAAPPNREAAGHGGSEDAEPRREEPPKDASSPTGRDPTEVIRLSEDPSALTVLARDGSVLAKVWKRSQSGSVVKANPKLPKHFVRNEVSVSPPGIRGLAKLLESARLRRNLCVIRGSIRADQALAKSVLRRKNPRAPDPRAPEGSPNRNGEPAYFREAPNGRSWLLVDVDDLQCPADIDPREDPEAAVRHAISELPPAFHDVTCWYSWSGSMGMGKTAWKLLKIHLWFWLKEPLRDAHLREWATRDPAAKIVDAALFDPVQVHYTADPVFSEGVEDPFGPDSDRPRSGLIEGASDEVELGPVVEPYVRAAEEKKARYARRESRGGTRRAGWNAISGKTKRFLADGCGEGERNGSLFAAACDVAGCGISLEEALPRLLEAASACRPPMDADEARKAVESAFATPREPSRPPLAGGEPDFGSEFWFARLLVKAHGRDLRHVGRRGKWMVWSEREGRWREDDDGETVRRAKSVALKEAMAEAEAFAEVIDEAKRESDGEGGGGSDFYPRKLVGKYQQRTPLNNAVALAASEAEVVAAVDAWDADPWLLNVANGTLDLRTGELRAHRREDLITKRSPVRFDPNASAPTWEAFLERVIPDPEVREYVGRFLGYALTGDVGEHVLHIFWGGGANGKSTLLETVIAVMGDYAASAPSTLLMQAKGERHPTELATLCGRRFVVSPESPEGGRLNENLVKSLTGGDTITARRMREDFWSFVPTHKQVLATNHRPRIVGTDEGIWRRVRLIPFGVTIPEGGRDPKLREKLDAEAEGILAWLVRGAAAYRERGLEPPEAVRVATAEYRDAEDTLAEFVEDRVVRAPGAFLPSRDLHEAYRLWCVNTGVPESRRLSQRSLSERLVDRGYVTKRTKKDRGFADIRITDALDSIGDAAVTQGDASNRPASPRNALPGQEFASIGDAVTSEGPLMDQHARAHTHARTHADMPSDAALRHQRHRAEGDAAENGAPDRPPRPCYSCRGRRFRRRGDGPWTCDRCHPAPNRADPEVAWADVPEDADDRE